MAETKTGKAETPVAATAKRTRVYRKRTKFQVPPKPPLPVRQLWTLASEEERKRAHETAVVVLETWLGKAKPHEAAAKLGTTRLRLWQLSQQAISGMVAGLLKQPRPRAGARLWEPEDDPKALRQRIRELETEMEGTRSLVRLLRELPGHRREAPEREAKRGRKTGALAVTGVPAASGAGASQPRPAAKG